MHPAYCYVIYQTQKPVFDRISKHHEESWKYDTAVAKKEMLSNSVLSDWYTILNWN